MIDCSFSKECHSSQEDLVQNENIAEAPLKSNAVRHQLRCYGRSVVAPTFGQSLANSMPTRLSFSHPSLLCPMLNFEGHGSATSR